MSEIDSRTCLETIKSVAEMLKYFSLRELLFILDQDTKVSKLDEMRIKKIADGVRFMYGGNQSEVDVALAVDLLSKAFAQCEPSQEKMSLSLMSHRRSFEHMIEPFIEACPTCREFLSVANTKQRSVKVYGKNGSVAGGNYLFRH